MPRYFLGEHMDQKSTKGHSGSLTLESFVLFMFDYWNSQCITKFAIGRPEPILQLKSNSYFLISWNVT